MLLSLQLTAEVQEDFFFPPPILNAEVKILFLLVLQKVFTIPPGGNLNTDFSLVVKAVIYRWMFFHCGFEHSQKLHCTPVPEPCQGKPVQWHWGQFKEIRFSITWNLTFLVLSDMSSENNFIFTLFKFLKCFFPYAPISFLPPNIHP